MSWEFGTPSMGEHCREGGLLYGGGRSIEVRGVGCGRKGGPGICMSASPEKYGTEQIGGEQTTQGDNKNRGKKESVLRKEAVRKIKA